ncbi:MAPEG family protein [Qipengyuania flava]|uniref:MAPEG family protein n=1 Tax=Qipengyuania flava TaxID=192812 RepID=UPI001C566123|nr:MAPEG family protein [Qipengyuania flava]MBW3168864.1 MAPEG family protein [Qipengyuania flava]MBY5966102.1 MAPEG family protein [Qipengyuania flava]MBY6012426.1 MAPEG family protein [Qipengyuania flava]MBY6026868.1 MAPEG family protein [Qipengyuania flava]
MLAQMLAPAAVLVAWSIVILFWMAFTRLPALGKAGGLGNAKPGGRGQDLEGVLPDRINWKSHNYAHLMEQPTLFYAVSVIIALMGAGAVDVVFAWFYVGLRIVHSIWQVTVNVVKVRFLLFLASTAALIYLAYRALALTLFHDPGLAPA